MKTRYIYNHLTEFFLNKKSFRYELWGGDHAVEEIITKNVEQPHRPGCYEGDLICKCHKIAT
jgi:hypothetical protein